MTRIIKLVKIVLISILVLAFIFINVPLPINITNYAIEIIMSNPYHAEVRAVNIRGWYRFNIFVGWHSFTGIIEIDGYPETENELLFSPLRLTPGPPSVRRGVRMGMLYYSGQQELEAIPDTMVEVLIPENFGVVYSTPFFRNALILIASNGVISHSESPMVVINATTREEAMIVARTLLE